MRKSNDILYSVRKYENLDKSFTKISNTVLKIVKDPYQYTIYSYLCSLFNREYGYAFPSIRKISKDTHISTKKVQSSLKELEELGLIKILKFEENKGVGFPNNIYKIFFPIIFEEKETYQFVLSEKQIKELEELEERVFKTSMIEDENDKDSNE